MRLIRLYVDVPLAASGSLTLPPTALRHAQVLRLNAGQPVLLFNGDGRDYRATLEHISNKSATACLQGSRVAATESPLAVTLVQSMAKGQRMDWVIQKATELGVARLIPVATERSEVRLDATRARKRLQHWRAVAIAACEQCGRATLPDIEMPQSLEHCLARPEAVDTLRLALIPGATQHVRDLTVASARIMVVAGPEGGFGEHDLCALREAGFSGLSLGPRTLRTETAGPATLAALQACHGDA